MNAECTQRQPCAESVLAQLTPREREILDLVGRGHSIAEIARQLSRSEKTIKSHRLALGRKLGVSNRVELARIAIEAGLAPLRMSSVLEHPNTNKLMRDELSKREKAQAALQAIDAGIVSATGRNFFQLLVQHLAQALEVRFAMVGRLQNDEEPKSIETIAIWAGERLVPNCRFAIPGTPCEHTLRKGICNYPHGVSNVFRIPEFISEFSVECYLGVALPDRAGKLTGALMVMHDRKIDESFEPERILRIFADRAGSELRRLESEVCLKRSESRLADVQRIAQLGCWDWNIATNVLTWSQETYRIFGVRLNEFGATYEAFLNTIHPDDRSFVIEQVDSALYDRRPFNIMHRIIRPDQTARRVHTKAEIISDETGRPVHMFGVVQDITNHENIAGTVQNLSEQLVRHVG